MEIQFTVETIDGKTWTATCPDPALACEGKDIIEASKNMSGLLENWFTETFNTTRKVQVQVPTIKAKIKANIIVRNEKPLNEFPCHEGEPEPVRKVPPLPMPPKPVVAAVDGPCSYLSDGKDLLPVGCCEAASNDISDTPGLQTDGEGVCNGRYEKCPYYKSRSSQSLLSAPSEEDIPIEDDDEDAELY